MLLDDPTAPHRQDLTASVFKVTEVTDDTSSLTDNQNYILDYFNSKTNKKRLITRSDLNPIELVKFLPNIALFDISYDEQGKLSNVIARLLGTAISDFYGDLTGASVFSDVVKNASPDLQDRLLAQVTAALEYKNAVTTLASASIESRTNIRIITLAIPMSSDGADIDKIFIYLEIEANQ